jgi:esterase/lipase superfamily enzyme
MGTRSAQAGQGLSPVQAASGTLIGFSTQPGNVALDGTGRNSPYTTALLNEIEVEGRDLHATLAAVRGAVMRATDSRQVPWEHTSLIGPVMLKEGTSAVAVQPQQSPTSSGEAERAWGMVKDSSNVELLEAFAARYSDSIFAAIAKGRLADLKAQKETAGKKEEERPYRDVSARPKAIYNEPELVQSTDVVSAACVDQGKCSLVPVFFGTDRKMSGATEDRHRFSGDRGQKLQFGRAIVTVPKAQLRKRGEIPVPNWWQINVLRVPAGGDPAQHFTIPQGGIQVFRDAYQFAAALQRHHKSAGDYKDHAFVFVHGYNTTFEHAVHRTAQIAYDLGSEDVPFGTAHLYSWPSGGGMLDYKYDFDSARFAVEHLRDYLETVVGMSPARNIHLIAHSMGAWLLMNVLDKWDNAIAAGKVINQIVLAAPDIDVAEYEKLAAKVHRLASGVTLYASANDSALMASLKVHRDMPRAGFVTASGPFLASGIDVIDISNIGSEVFSNGHSEYADKRELLNDIALLLRKGERPPHIRSPILERIKRSEAEYWKYPR